MGVVVRDARRLSPAAQEDLRRRAVAAVKAGFTQAAVSTVLGVSPQAVSRWVNAFARKGKPGAESRQAWPPGRAEGPPPTTGGPAARSGHRRVSRPGGPAWAG